MFKNYLKISLRNLQKHRAYTIINVLGLALSITCCIFIFTLVKYHLGFDTFHADADRIYRVVTEQHQDNIDYTSSVPAPLGKAFRNDYTYAEKVARIATFDGTLITIEAGNEKKKFKENAVAVAEPEFFDIFNYPLLRGDKKTVLTEPNTAIITESAAKKYFGNADPVNKVFRINNNTDIKVTGILKDFPARTDTRTAIYLSYPTLKEFNSWLASEDSWGGISSEMKCYMRLKPGVDPRQVENDLFAYVKKFRAKSKNVHHYKLQPLADIHFNPHYGGAVNSRTLWVLSFIGLFLIVTACVNFINLATAQALKRSKEVGVRKVLGSVRRQIFWQFISETAVITVLAVGLAFVLSGMLLTFANEQFSSQMSINLFKDWQLCLFIGLLIVIVTFLAGFYPGLIMAGFKPVQAIKGKISQQSIGGFNTRRALIVTQFAISQVLVIGMVVIAGQMRYIKDADLGFNKDAVVMLPAGDITTPAKNTLKDLLSKDPGVRDVSLCFAAPASIENWSTSLKYNNNAEDENFSVGVRAADDKYISTFGIQLVAGRNIFPADSATGFLVNETLVKRLNLQSPAEVIGKTLAINGSHIVAPIVGVVKDFHDRSLHNDISPICIASLPTSYQSCAVKINMAQMSTALAAIEKTWNALHPDQIYEYHFLDEQLAQFYHTEELMLQLIGAFSFIAIFIGCLGLYGLVSFMVSQKTKEIGIRKVLGGSLRDMLWIFGREFARLIFIALVIAGPLGWLLMNNWLRNFKYRIAVGPWVFLLTIIISVVVALLAGGYQSVKAAIANPVKSLRAE